MMKRKAIAGFSLMEMVVAIGVFSVAMLTLTFAFARDLVHVRRLCQEEVAVQILQGELEALRAKPYNDLEDCVDARVDLAGLIPRRAAEQRKLADGSVDGSTREAQGKASVVVTGNGSESAGLLSSAQCAVTIQEYDPERPGLKRVKVTLTWLAGSKRPKQRTMETLIADVAR